jgi:hypothetical protein
MYRILACLELYGGGPRLSGRFMQKGIVAEDGFKIQPSSELYRGERPSIKLFGGGLSSSKRSVPSARKAHLLPSLTSSTPMTSTESLEIEIGFIFLRDIRVAPSTVSEMCPSTVLPPTNSGDGRYRPSSTRSLLALALSRRSVRGVALITVCKGAGRFASDVCADRFMARRTGDLDRPLLGTVFEREVEGGTRHGAVS